MSAGAAKLSDMKGELPPTLRYLAGNQSGVVSRAQALRAGLTVDMIKFRVRSGRWQQLHPGVYATFSGIPGRGAWLWAALLAAGPGAVLSYQTAAELNGFAGVRPHRGGDHRYRARPAASSGREPVTAATTRAVSVRSGRTTCAPAAARSAAG
jgi:hypothetical protein